MHKIKKYISFLFIFALMLSLTGNITQTWANTNSKEKKFIKYYNQTIKNVNKHKKITFSYESEQMMGMSLGTSDNNKMDYAHIHGDMEFDSKEGVMKSKELYISKRDGLNDKKMVYKVGIKDFEYYSAHDISFSFMDKKDEDDKEKVEFVNKVLQQCFKIVDIAKEKKSGDVNVKEMILGDIPTIFFLFKKKDISSMKSLAYTSEKIKNGYEVKDRGSSWKLVGKKIIESDTTDFFGSKTYITNVKYYK